MGVNCSKNTKVKQNRQSLIKFKLEIPILDQEFDASFISDSIFFNILIKKLFNDNFQEEKEEINKRFEIILLDSSSNCKLNMIFGQIIDYNKLNSSLNKEMKILYDFKTIILMKNKEKASFPDKILSEFISFLRNANVSLKKMLILVDPFQLFLQNFPFFMEDHTLIKKNLFQFPLIIFDFNDIISDKPSKNKKSIVFVDSNENFLKNLKNFQLYSDYLKVHSLIILEEDRTKYNTTELEKKFGLCFCDLNIPLSRKNAKQYLKKEILMDSHVLFIYNNKYQELVDFLIEFLCKIFKCPVESINDYFQKLFPEKNSNKPINNNQINDLSGKKIIKKKSSLNIENKSKNRCEEMITFLEEIHKKIQEMNPLIEIIQKLLTNIINEPGNEKFRSIKRSNEKLKKTIFSSSESKKLLELCGFCKSKDNKDVYLNILDILNLKIIKSDFDLAAKNFLFK